ncbi:MAG: substrate-binding domain-containing protein [Clostridia bacterium]|nr:substrate-binding domain-containing protein [Clostridia bacterium]
MKTTKKVLVLVLVAVLLVSCFAFVACNKDEQPTEEVKVVRISTTTSVNDSGLMGYLQPFFEKDTGYKWEIASAGTGAAINAAKYGNADVILVHSKKQEEPFVEAGFGKKVNGYKSERISFMYNYFVLVGPTVDESTYTSVKDAFATIANNENNFISRGDKSGTHTKEVGLWNSELGITDDVTKLPEGIKGWYISAGQGMGACLTMANEKNGYCLTDKATYLSFKNNPEGDKLPNLHIIYEEDNDLKNTYTMIAVNPDAKFIDSVSGEELPAGSVTIDTVAAETFINWMTSEHAKALISFYGTTKYGGSLFTLQDGYLAA